MIQDTINYSEYYRESTEEWIAEIDFNFSPHANGVVRFTGKTPAEARAEANNRFFAVNLLEVSGALK